MTLKDILLELMGRTYQEQLSFIEKLPEAERSVVGAANNWAAKDIIAHVVVWQIRFLDDIAAVQRGETAREYGPIDDENTEIFEAHRDATWEDICQKAQDTQSRMVALVREISDAALTEPALSPLKNDRAFWTQLVGYNVTHTLLHLGQYYAEHGQEEYAAQVVQSIFDQLLTLDDSPQWQGVTLYNLACCYALVGQKTEAITRLSEALQLSPQLTDWSQQDPDLACIREEPGYDALYA